MHSTLRRLDLNLLLLFDALYQHRSVVQAAEALSISPSAFSHGLKRLRDSLGDELFVRYGAGMQPTARADHFAAGVRAALSALTESMGQAGPFNPAASSHTFVLAATDFTAFALLPTLVAHLGRIAPGIRLRVEYTEHGNAAAELAAGRVHFALGFHHSEFDASGIEAMECFEDRYVVLHRAGHPRIGAAPTLAQYLDEHHIAVLPWPNESSIIDTTLHRMGCRRTVAVELPSLLAAPFLLAASDHLLTVPQRIAKTYDAVLPLVVCDLPFEAPRYRAAVFYHRRHVGNPASAWLKSLIHSCLAHEGEESALGAAP